MRSLRLRHGASVIVALAAALAATVLPASAAESRSADSAVASYALPLPQDALPRGEYDDPHHDYPSIDLPVPTGTEAYAVTSGQAVVFTGGGCGNGVELTGDDGALYTYCHLSSHAISSGPVEAGELLGLTGSTGNSTGPHLHFQIKTSGTLRCPQQMLLAIYDGVAPPAPTDLPTSGCSYVTSSDAEPLGRH